MSAPVESAISTNVVAMALPSDANSSGLRPGTDGASNAHYAIIGSGITGLSAAYEALQQAQKTNPGKPVNIDVYEADDKDGGKIQTGAIGTTAVNQGAEFIDSDQTHMIALAQSLGVPLIDNKGADLEKFQRPDGSVMNADSFYDSYKPYAQQVQRDRAEMEANPTGPRAQHINRISLEAYLAEMEAGIPLPNRSIKRWVKDTFTARGNEAHTTLAIASGTYAAEMGQPAANISAASFVAETSHELDSLLASDCAFRVEGGTYALIAKLHEKLASAGVHFHTGAEATAIHKQQDGKLALNFTDPALNTIVDRVIFATPSSALAKVQGLNELGLSEQGKQLLHDTQYTKNIKLTVSFKPGKAPQDSTFFSSLGFQCWSPEPHLLTLLAEAQTLESETPKAFIMKRLDAYAKAHGTTTDAMFDLSPGKFDYNNPGSKPCYCSPKPGQAHALEALKSELPGLARNGIGITGTFLPLNGAVGFMECGVASAQQSVALLTSKQHDKATTQQPQQKMPTAPETGAQWQHYIAARETGAIVPPSEGRKL